MCNFTNEHDMAHGPAAGGLMQQMNKILIRFYPSNSVKSVCHNNNLKRNIMNIRRNAANMKRTITDMRCHIANLKHNIVNMKRNMPNMKRYMTDMKCNIADIKRDIVDINGFFVRRGLKTEM